MTVCCLNPTCSKPENPDNSKFCVSCGNPIVLLRNHYYPLSLLSDEGGFGRTYLAEDRDKLNEKCVIKQLFPKVTGSNALKKAKELFEQEAQQLQKLGQHPQIPSLLAYFQEGNELYLIQEFIEGQTLDHLNINWTENEIRNFLNGILPVLQYIHDQKLIHRDLKPPNIMVRKPKPPFNQGMTEEYVLIDFGASKDFAQTVATVGTRIGTFGYSPEEQMKLGEAYPASDLYSIGVTCFYLLTGENVNDLYVDNGCNWVNNWQQYLRVNITPELRTILNKLLQKDRVNRYQSAEEVLKALNAPPVTVKISSSTGNNPVPQPPKPPQKTVVSKPPVKSPPPPPPVPRRDVLKAIGFTTVGVIATVVGAKLFNPKNNNNTPETDPPQPPLEKGELETFDLGNGVSLEMVKIPAGSFLMGSPDSDPDADSDEKPQHQVTISEDFYLGKYEVTQAQYQAIMGKNPSSFNKGGNYPVESVSWDDAVEFCQKLSTKTGKTFKLPSEAQWEYACRAVTSHQLPVTKYYFGDDESQLGDYAWYDQNSDNQTHPVGEKTPNNFGLYDMMGNVLEWCEDYYHENYNDALNNSNSSLNNPSEYRVLRGGSWYLNSDSCRSAFRSWIGLRNSDIGFRVFPPSEALKLLPSLPSLPSLPFRIGNSPFGGSIYKIINYYITI